MTDLLSTLSLMLEWQRPNAVRSQSRVTLRPRRHARLHLGCGERHLRGYLNVDLSPEEGTASGQAHPDLEADIRHLHCSPDSLREVRLHHVLEHFERAEALALLIRWHEWLRPGGLLVVETPDFEHCTARFGKRSFVEQTAILRHVFGSQEAPWAQHRDGWSPSRFTEILLRLGYTEITHARGFSDEQELLANVCVTARKPVAGLPWDERVLAATQLLEFSMNGTSVTEQRLLKRWRNTFDRTVGEGPG